MRTSLVLAVIGSCAAVTATPLAATSAPAGKAVVDLADTVEGTYVGDVISDSRGSSQSGVTITVKKVAPGTVSVSSDYRRLPTFNVRLTRAMQTIQQAGGDNVFLIDQAKSPWTLDVTVDGASWSGTRQ